MSSPLRFPLTEVKESGLENVEVRVPAGLFPDAVDDGKLAGELLVKGILTKQDDEVAFDGTVEGGWLIECTRCLVPVSGAFKGQVESRASIDAGPLDVTEDVRQAIVLAQPLKILCRPDCKGFCQTCRANRNTTDCGHSDQGPSQGRIRLVPPEAR
ncbi:MAG: DUF177 domain-containing protein [Elusimicrobiota bacterium]|nr:DUF177 domain-containing protein [Elusimicrobiota bacterium]